MKKEKKDKKEIDLEKHEIFLGILGELPKINEKFNDAETKYKKPRLTKREEFIFDLFHHITEINNKVIDLEFSSQFITTFPNYKPWRKLMTRDKYIIYHLEFYYINIIALFDRLLHLINFLYDLGLIDRFVTFDCITTNKNVDKKVVDKIKGLNRMLNNIRANQNSIKHKRKLKIKEIYNPSLIEFILKNNLFNEDFSEEQIKNLKSDMDFQYKLYLNRKQKELKENNKVLKEAIIMIFDDLIDQYKKKNK